MTTSGGSAHSGAQLSVRMITGLPTPLARGLRLASSRVGSDAERFAARIAFLDGALRFLVAVQDAERAQLDLQRPAKLVELVDRMERATLGMWAEAARSLARELAAADERPLPPVGSGLLAEGTSSELHDGVDALIRLRNQVAHGADLGALAPEQARRALEDSDAPFRALVRGLEPLCALRLVVEVDGHERHDERWAARLVVHRGEEPTVHEIVVDDHALPTRQPVFLADDGRVVRAVPWMLAEQSGNVRRVVLLERWRDSGPTWSEPGGTSTRAEWLEAEGHAPVNEDPRSWFDRLQASRRRRRLPVDVVRGLQPPMDVDRPPWVRQCRPIRLLGRGGTGAVWLVEDPEREHARLALKVLHPALAANREHVERMRNEYEALRRLQVPGVVQVIDVWHDEVEGPCLLMEWVEGRSLAQVARDGPMPPARAVEIVCSLLRTLAIAHERAIIHRDLKPSNVILTAAGPRLIDFGVARLVDGATLTATADIVGTLAYAAPEQLRGEKAGPAADLYGAGRILQELLVGAAGEDSALDAIPSGLQRVIRKALRPEPRARFTSAAEMVASLEEAMAGGAAGCALDEGDALGGGLVVVSVGEEVVDGVYLVRARTRTGEEAALLAPRLEAAAREAFRRRIGEADPARRSASGCLGTRVTEDGVPYVELLADDAWGRARVLLGLPVADPAGSDRVEPAGSDGAPTPPRSPAPTAEADPAAADGPLPASGGASAGEVAMLALGAAAAGALAAHALGSLSKGAAAPRPQPGTKPAPARSAAGGAAPAMAQLFRMMLGSGGSEKTRGPATDLSERTHHLGLLLLALDVACFGLDLSETNWRAAWGTRHGGLLMLAKLGDRSSGPFSHALLARPELEACRAAAVELARSRSAPTPASTARVAAIRGLLLAVLREGAHPFDQRPAKRPGYVRMQQAAFHIRGIRPEDGWWIVDVQEA